MLLKINTRTLNGERERFARVSVLIDMNKPLLPFIQIGKAHTQFIQYEGVDFVLFMDLSDHFPYLQ